MYMRKLIFYIINSSFTKGILIPYACSNKKVLNEIKPQIMVSEFSYKNASFHQCHALTIIEAGNELLASGFGGAKENNFGNCIYVSEKKEGKWSTLYLLPMG